MHSSQGGDYTDMMNTSGFGEEHDPSSNLFKTRKRRSDQVDLGGSINELIRVPHTLNTSPMRAVPNYKDNITAGSSNLMWQTGQNINHSSTMSMYAAALKEKAPQTTFRRSQVPQRTLNGLSDAKLKFIKEEFLIGEQMHDGDLGEMIVFGSSVLSNEINHAKSIPSKDRVLIRKESSVFELQQME